MHYNCNRELTEVIIGLNLSILAINAIITIYKGYHTQKMLPNALTALIV